MQVLVFGKTGQVAQGLARATWPAGTSVTFLDRQAANLAHPERLGTIVRSNAPDAVVIAAAYTNVDAAERGEKLATTINAAAPEAIARAAAEISIPVLHLSTDYVFDGEKREPYDEADAVGPLNAYGRSKLAGENAVRAANPRHLIIRSSWIYSAHGKSFFRAMLKQAEASEEARVVDDQHGCPTAAHDIASAIAHALPAVLAKDGPWGTYHLAGNSETTWHGFAEAIFEGIRARGMRRPRNIAIGTAEYPTPAKRPRNSRLSSEAFARDFSFRLPGFEAALPAVLDEAFGPVRQRQAVQGAAR